MKKIAPLEIRPFLKALSDEILNAAIHYQLYKDLNESVRDYSDEMNTTPAFWNLTMNANLTAARSALFRAYDFSVEGVNLSRLLAHIEDHVSVDKNEIDADRRLVSRTDPLIERNLWQRNNLFAHKNFGHIVGKLGKVKYDITHGELQELIDRAVEILNKYSQRIRRGIWSTQIVGHDDYKNVLRAVKYERDAYLKRCEAEEAEMSMDTEARRKAKD
jgi:hypothetical protein